MNIATRDTAFDDRNAYFTAAALIICTACFAFVWLLGTIMYIVSGSASGSHIISAHCDTLYNLLAITSYSK